MNVILFGAPGAGKSVQANLLHKNLDYQIISMGQLLRNAMKKNTPTGRYIRETVGKGELVSNKVCSTLLQHAVNPIQPIVFDGFPRSEDQLSIVNASHLSGKIIVLDTDYDTIYRRLINRGRHDDTDTIIKNRWDIYQTTTLPLIEKLRLKYNIHSIDANQDIETIHKTICNLIGKVDESLRDDT